MRFKATLLQSGKTSTGIPVPAEVIEGLGGGKRPAVSVTVNGFTYRTTVGSFDGAPMISVSGERREAAGLRAGDEVEVEIALDNEPRIATPPPDLAEALAADGAAQRAFDALSYSHKQQHILAVEGAKTPETRARRIEKALATLREQK